MSADFDVDLDVRGMSCPLPILKTKKQLAVMAAGQRLRVRATDPHSPIDFTAFCEKSGNPMLRHERIDAEFHFVVAKKEA